MTSLRHHGIEHLSPSSINLFAAAPAVFIMEKVLKRRGSVGPAAHRGTAVEAGIVHGLLTDAPLAECQREAVGKFGALTALQTGDKVDKEGAAIPLMVDIGLKELKPYGRPTSTQGKVVHQVEGLAVPILGYYDLWYQPTRCVIDIKTTHALPSRVSTTHARQVALYQKALGDGAEARIAYVTPKKSATYVVENIEEHLKALERIAFAIQRFLSISADPHELAGLIVPDVESFYVTGDPAMRQAAYDIWGV